LATPKELLDGLPVREKWTEEKLEKTLDDLKMDDYFDLLFTDRKGERTYVITLRAAGQAFERNALQTKRNYAVKLIWAVASAIVAFLVGVILRRIF
jgi:hypothetical protein